MTNIRFYHFHTERCIGSGGMYPPREGEIVNIPDSSGVYSNYKVAGVSHTLDRKHNASTVVRVLVHPLGG